jgi:hypothetical protein
MKKYSFGLWVVLSSLCLVGIARGTPVEFAAILSGAAESPANGSLGTGLADVWYDSATHLLQVSVTFSGLTGTTTASHIHAATALPGVGTAGVATQTPTFSGFPLGVTSGSYLNTLDLTLASSFNPAYVTANGGIVANAEAALVAAMWAGESYLNIHSTDRPGGEIRGFLTAVPDNSATAAMLILGLIAMAGFFRCQRAQAVAMVK